MGPLQDQISDCTAFHFSKFSNNLSLKQQFGFQEVLEPINLKGIVVFLAWKVFNSDILLLCIVAEMHIAQVTLQPYSYRETTIEKYFFFQIKREDHEHISHAFLIKEKIMNIFLMHSW